MGKSSNSSKLVSKKKLPSIEYGLDGIMRIFKVSKSTAWRYRHGILEPACVQNGNKIIIDVRKALSLFGCPEVDDMVEAPAESE